MNRLKPCPFCGCAAHVYEDERFSKKPYDFPKWYITCLGCGVSTPTARMELIVKIWNRRIENECSSERDDFSQMLCRV